MILLYQEPVRISSIVSIMFEIRSLSWYCGYLHYLKVRKQIKIHYQNYLVVMDVLGSYLLSHLNRSSGNGCHHEQVISHAWLITVRNSNANKHQRLTVSEKCYLRRNQTVERTFSKQIHCFIYELCNLNAKKKMLACFPPLVLFWIGAFSVR